MACENCQGTCEVTRDGESRAAIAAKDGKRPAWVGLLARTRFMPCPLCEGSLKVDALVEPPPPLKRGPGRPRKFHL